MGKFGGVFRSSNTRCQRIKGGVKLGKEISFPILTTMVVPKPTPLFHPESNEEANQAIQVAVDAQAHLNHLNEELQEMNHQEDAVKAAKEAARSNSNVWRRRPKRISSWQSQKP